MAFTDRCGVAVPRCRGAFFFCGAGQTHVLVHVHRHIPAAELDYSVPKCVYPDNK